MSDGDLIFCCGKKRSGKTSLATRATIRDVRAGRNALALDPTGDVRERLTGNSASGDALPKEHVIRCRTAAEARAVFERNAIENLFAPRHQVGRVAVLSDKNQFAIAAAAHWSDGFVKLVDECEEFWPNVTILPELPNRIYRTCGNTGSRIYAVSQRPQSVSVAVRGNADFVCSFRTDSSLVLKALGDCGADPDVWSPCLTLDQHICLVRGPWREAFDTPLARMDARTDAIPWKAKP